MKERPIIFSGLMVRAILEGRKTQTRRILVMDSIGPYASSTITKHEYQPGFWLLERWRRQNREMGNFGRCETFECPYGVPGDRLWVRETFNVGWLDGGKVLYRADGGSAKKCGYPKEPRWKSSLFMKRSESRLTLEITDVLVERVQDISQEDIRAEGVRIPSPFVGIDINGEAVEYEHADKDPWWFFQQLWDSINAKRGYGWDVNPWVWALTFKPLPEAPKKEGA